MAASSKAHRSVARATFVATAGTVAGYATTLVQWAVYARVFGISSATDALAAALSWMVGLTGLFGFTFASVTIPLYLRALSSDASAARNVFRTAHVGAVMFGIAISALTFVLAPQLASLLLPGSLPSSREELTGILRICAPLGLVWVLVYTMTSLANAHERYGLAALSTVIPSLPVIAVLLLLPRVSIATVAGAFVVGMTTELLILGIAIWPWRSNLAPAVFGRAIAQLARPTLAVAAAYLLIIISGLVLRAFASFGGTGDVTVIDYGMRIVTAVESALLSGALAVVLTVWSSDAASSNGERIPIAASVRAAIGFIIPAALAIVVFAPAIVSLLLGGGRFLSSDVGQVSRLLGWISLGLAAHAVYLVLLRVLLARGLFGVLFASAVCELFALTVAAWALGSRYGLDGLGAAYSLSWLITALLVAVSLSTLRDTWSVLLSEIVRAVVTGAVASGVALLAIQPLPDQPLAQLMGGGVVFALAWLGIGRAVRLAAFSTALAALSPRTGTLRLHRPP